MKRRFPIAEVVFIGLCMLPVAAVGSIWIIEGVERGRRLADVNPREVLHLVVEGTTPRPGLFSGESRAHGKVAETGETTDVAIFSREFDTLVPGNQLEVFRLGVGRPDFVFRRKYAESQPLIRVAGYAVSWHFPAGIVMLLVALAVSREVSRNAIRLADSTADATDPAAAAAPPAMGFICPACRGLGSLNITSAIELESDGRSDEIELQLVECTVCRFRGVAVYEESRRGSLDSESVDHTGYKVAATEFEALAALVSRCPKPSAPRCRCPTHQALNRKDRDGRWYARDGFRTSASFPMEIARSRMDEFGCARCFQTFPEEIDAFYGGFTEIARLIDESHFIVRILQCPHCGQRCVSIFTETIDWNDGDDAQYRSLLPISAEESARLIAQGEGLNVQAIEELGLRRRFFRMDHPTGQPKRVRWVNGMLSIGHHD